MNVDPDEVRDLETLALSLAQGAAEVVRRGSDRASDGGGAQSLVVDTKSSATDLVTEVDRATEAWLVDQLAQRRPGDDVLGEEGAGHGTSGDTTDTTDTRARVRWVLDPIDGTVNFVLGLPYYAVSVAAEVDGTVVAGAVCNPARGETFHARRGGGATLLRDGRPPQRLTGPRRVPLARAVLATGFAYDAEVRGRQIAVVAGLLPRVADIRRLGAAALDLCHVAAGRVDGYFEAGLNLWDYAAGALIAAEAGCAVTGLGGRAASSRFVAAAGPDLVEDLERLLLELAADRVR